VAPRDPVGLAAAPRLRTVSISTGVLVVGSLYWEATPARKHWRESRLNMEDHVQVFAPIRYGRKSSATRGGAYTMVLSRELCSCGAQAGTAIIVGCLRPVSTVDDLILEAEWLWAAERNVKDRTSALSADWGCVALLVNPNTGKGSSLLDAWAKRTRLEPHYGRLNRAQDEAALVDATGQIQIPWLQRIDGKSIDKDLLLVTATNPTITNGRYPTSEEIALAWKTGPGRAHVNYFWNNRKCGTQTYQDAEIEALLNSTSGQRI
jgi:hypothetical protein